MFCVINLYKRMEIIIGIKFNDILNVEESIFLLFICFYCIILLFICKINKEFVMFLLFIIKLDMFFCMI